MVWVLGEGSQGVEWAKKEVTGLEKNAVRAHLSREGHLEMRHEKAMTVVAFVAEQCQVISGVKSL